jgi:tetratricopeptide (TPR) repeat protein
MGEPRVADGQVLGGRYALGAEVGRGGMATVYRARDLQLDRTVAVKVLLPDISPLLGGERFAREIRIAATLQHPNIVPVFDSGADQGEVWYVMPLVEGETLRDRLRRETHLPIADAVRIAADVLEALAHAHANGVVHRDIKPENILLSGDRALVADFGVARAVDQAGGERITSSGLVVGTPYYMSPEQAGGQGVDGRADLYAVACVLYEMVGGEPPFMGPTPQAILARQMQEPPRSLRVVRPNVPAALQAVIERGLAKVPADRFASAAAFADALAQAERRPQGPRSLPRILRLAAAVILPVAAGLATWWLWPRHQLDANKVMGFPLVAQGGVAQAAVEQVEVAVAAAMQDTDPLRWLRARLFLGTDVPAGVPADAATRLTRDRGARYWLGGSLALVGESLVVRLELFDARGDSLLASRAEAGPQAMPAYALAFRAVNALLPHIVGRSTHVDETYLERHPPAAVAKWLEGEVAYRNARYDDAMEFYRAALAVDSTLAPAALKAAMTAAWQADYAVGDSLIRYALHREADLPPLNRQFARGLQHQFAGHGDSAYRWFRRVVEAAPDWSEGWYGLGEAAYHLWPAVDGLDALARDAFERSVALDADFAPVVFHLAELTIVAEDHDAAARLVERHRRLSADRAQLVELEVMQRCVRDGPGAVDWRAAAGEPGPADQMLSAGRLLAAGGRHVPCAEAAYRAALLSPVPDADVSRRWDAALGLHHIYIARGEHTRAQRLADSVAASGVTAGRGLRILAAILGAGPDSAGAAAIAAIDAPLDSATVALLVWFGQWAAHVGDTLRLDAVARELSERAAEGDPSAEIPARTMRARLLAARGDSAAAIDSLGALAPIAPIGRLVWRYWEALAPERMLRARLLAAAGRTADAIAVAETFDGQRSAVDVAWLPASLALRRDAARAGVARDASARYAQRLAALQEGNVGPRAAARGGR